MSASKPQETAGSADGGFVTSRVFDAPRSVVWTAFTDSERMKQWWGPKGFTVIAATMDLRPGGRYHYGLRSPDGAEMWGKFVFRQIVPLERIEFINSFSDKSGGTTRHPMHMTWPLEMLSVFTFEEVPRDKTRFTLNWSPWNATAEEQKTFNEGHQSMLTGWGGTLDQLAAYLAREQAGTRP